MAAGNFVINAAWEARDGSKEICLWFVAWKNITNNKMIGAIAGYSGGANFEVERFHAVLHDDEFQSIWIDYEDKISGEEIDFNSLDEHSLDICEGALDCIWKWNNHIKWGDTDELILIRNKRPQLTSHDDLLCLSIGRSPLLRTLCERAGLTAGPI